MAPALRLTKHHGLGNDFLVVLATRQDDGVALPAAQDAARWCDRHRGIGADGLIVARPGDGDDDGVDLVMELFNADGSVAEISGNGIRCLCQAELDRRGDSSGSLVIATAGGLRRLEAWPGPDAATLMVRVDMGSVLIGSEEPVLVPVGAVHAGTATVGNPHVVFDLGEPERVASFDIDGIGSSIDRETPGGVNVHVVAATGPSGVVMRHWERGAGVTEACGSGATVGAALMGRWGLVGPRVEVAMPGGSVTVEVGDGDGASTFLEGPTVHIADVEVRPDSAPASTVGATAVRHRG